jgi:hypothetical protein
MVVWYHFVCDINHDLIEVELYIDNKTGGLGSISVVWYAKDIDVASEIRCDVDTNAVFNDECFDLALTLAEKLLMEYEFEMDVRA